MITRRRESLEKVRKHLREEAHRVFTGQEPPKELVEPRNFVYIFRNPLNYNVIKIGLSGHPVRRIKDLYNTSTALPYEIVCVWEVDDMRMAEKAAHKLLEDHRINPDREYFELFTCEQSDMMFHPRNKLELICDALEKLIEIIEEEAFDSCGIRWERMREVSDILPPEDIRYL